MKIAVIGSGALALESATHFEKIGAEVKLFSNSESWGGTLTSSKAHLENINFKIADMNLLEYSAHLNDLGNNIGLKGLVKKGRVLRVHKRFLKPSQVVDGRSRLADLFRVIYRIDARKDIEQQREENKEVFEKLGEDVVASLKNSIESYEDFDLVIDATGPFSKSVPMGASNSLALNELVVRETEAISYTSDIKSELEKVTDKTKMVTFVGDGLYNLKNLVQLKELFMSSNLKIQLITQSSIPFTDIDETQYGKWIEGFKDLLSYDRHEYERSISEFEQKIIDWKNLESHIRAKTPRPAEPQSRIFVYNGAVVSSVDKLLDQKGLFLTIEGSSLLGSEDTLKTLSTEFLFVDNGHVNQSSFEKNLDENETGFFELKTETKYSLKDSDLLKINEIETEIMKYFSKA